MKHKISKLITSTCLIGLFCASANASIINFTSESDFAAASANAVTDTFNDLVSFDIPSTPFSRLVSTGSYDISLLNTDLLFVGSDSIAPSGEEYISNELSDTIIFSNFSNLPLNALSGFLFGSSQTPISASVSATIFDINGIASSITLDCDLDPANCFFGFTSTDVIERLEITSNNTDFVGLDDLSFADLAEVNAPATLAIFSLALFGLYRGYRRKSE